MALIKCPNCQKDISDKAISCIYCGEILKEESNDLKCFECGENISLDDICCPNCGYPIKKEENIKGVLGIKNIKKIIIISVVILFLFLAFLIGYNVSLKNDYINNLEKIQVAILDGGSTAEELCSLTERVWYNSIHEKRDTKTDKYTRPDKYFVSDFNTALNNLYTDDDTLYSIKEIKKSQEQAKKLIKKLQNPPNKLKECYRTVSDVYDSYKKLTDLAISPSGSYNEYNNNIATAISSFVSSYEKLDNQIPENRG